MNKQQAENKAHSFNVLVKHPDISYRAASIQPTKWEKD